MGYLARLFIKNPSDFPVTHQLRKLNSQIASPILPYPRVEERVLERSAQFTRSDKESTALIELPVGL
jgi:hypothetical protein